MRLFYAVRFDQTVQNALHTLQNRLRPHLAAGRMTRFENLHLTLVFVGEVAPARAPALIDIGRTVVVEPMVLRFGQIGRFRRSGGDLIWMAIEDNPALTALHRRLSAAVRDDGFPIEARRFKPHVTLCRAARFSRGFSLSELDDVAMPAAQVQTIHLMQSSRVNGVLTYSPLT